MEEKIETIEKIKFKRPKKYNAIMYNDDFTTMEFVIFILMDIFKKPEVEANKIMRDVHNKGKGVAGTYSYDIAMSKVGLALQIAKREDFPFKMTVEEV
ncbi:ATP-dependent Clp protease adaptor ClpS [uncultured Clostridium sp.]|uniref:ATP-dependent Clp protease adaptor ClpS n=1 Tax=uncultured Clostridium sp. TaxID=59620 RepID=UPI0026292DC9|nr:ATP-dependent Clp protease adaptor ClpS [uncultured Clostridium sp.]